MLMGNLDIRQAPLIPISKVMYELFMHNIFVIERHVTIRESLRKRHLRGGGGLKMV